jgi:hypothetical protein
MLMRPTLPVSLPRKSSQSVSRLPPEIETVPVALAVSLFVAYVFAPYLARKFIKFKKGGHG